MPEMIMTRADVLAEAMQFEGTQKNVDEIQAWINNYNGAAVLNWTGTNSQMSGDVKIQAEAGILQLYAGVGQQDWPMEAEPGDWIIKSSRDTFYTVDQETFNEVWQVMH